MADNYLERREAERQERLQAKAREKAKAWKKRLAQYAAQLKEKKEGKNDS